MNASFWGSAGVLALALASSAGCAGAGRDVRRDIVVEAEGWAPVASDNDLTSRHRALAEAQKKAVEKAVGVTVRANTRVADAVNIRQDIEANMGGVIRRYEILSEKKEEGFQKIRIRATVVYRPPEKKGKMRAQRFSVRLPDEKVTGAVRGTLVAWDFPLAETEAGADVLITGVVETHGLADPRLGGFYSYKAKVTLNVVDLRGGRSFERVEEATAVDLDDRIAREMALEKAGEAAGIGLATSFAPPPEPAEPLAALPLNGADGSP